MFTSIQSNQSINELQFIIAVKTPRRCRAAAPGHCLDHSYKKIEGTSHSVGKLSQSTGDPLGISCIFMPILSLLRGRKNWLQSHCRQIG